MPMMQWRDLKLHTKYYKNQMAICLNENGEVLRLVFNNYDGIDVNVGESIIHIFDSGFYQRFFDNLMLVNTNHVAFGFRVRLVDLQEGFVFFLKIEKSIHMFLIGVQDEINDMFDQLLEVNSEQIKMIREMYQKTQQKDDLNKYFEQIMMINNDLINTRRNLFNQKEQLERLNAELEVANSTDYLTKAFNRKKFYSDLSELPVGEVYVMINMDIDNFKMVNDLFGHHQGDQILIQFAELLESVFPDEDVKIYRIGGDEFMVLLKKVEFETHQNVFIKINAELVKMYEKLSVSYGIVEIDTNKLEQQMYLETQLRSADTAMYRFKKNSKIQAKKK